MFSQARGSYLFESKHPVGNKSSFDGHQSANTMAKAQEKHLQNQEKFVVLNTSHWSISSLTSSNTFPLAHSSAYNLSPLFVSKEVNSVSLPYCNSLNEVFLSCLTLPSSIFAFTEIC